MLIMVLMKQMTWLFLLW